MATQYSKTPKQPASLWDTAAGGVLPGLIGGLLMLAFLIVGGLLLGQSPDRMMAAFDRQNENPLRGGLSHLAVSCVYGVLFSVLMRNLTRYLRTTWGLPLLGIAYGLLLWLIAVGPLHETISTLLSAVPPPLFLLSHMVYGVTIGIAAERERMRALVHTFVVSGYPDAH